MTARLRSALPSLRASLHRPRGRLALLAVVVLTLGIGGYVATRGGWVNVLRLPPTLDAVTPRAQNGWVLKDIQLSSSYQSAGGTASNGFLFQGAEYQPPGNSDTEDTMDAFGLWLTPPQGDVVSSIPSAATGNPQQDPFFALAQLSTGETLPLVWHYISRTNWQQPLEKADGYIFLSLPTGYSEECRFVDITVSDRHNHAAHWHFSRLPRMRHAVPPPAKTVDTVTQSGITMTAKAWHVPGGLGDRNLGILLRPVLPPQSHQWDILVTRQEREWEPFGKEKRVSVYSESGTKVDGRNGVLNTGREQWFGGGIYSTGPDDPYPRTNRFLRLTTELRQYETYDESITFHNLTVQKGKDNDAAYFLSLPHPLSATTPSGVTVTLPAQSGFMSMAFAYSLNIAVKTSPQIKPEPVSYSLSASPLAKTCGKPVQISLTVGPPFHSSGWSYEQGDAPANYALTQHDMTERSFKLITPPPVLKNLTFIVHQRVDIQTIPMTFTLPIADRSPPYYPRGYQRPKR